MSAEPRIVSLVEATLESNNTSRLNAEHLLFQLADENPSEIAGQLAAAASDAANSVATRQACMLLLKTLLPMYWNFGFDAFRGKAIAPQAKQWIRQRLLDLACSEHGKISTVAAHVTGAIAAVDYPDEWPDLVAQLLSFIGSNEAQHIVGGLSVLAEMLDDCVSDREFAQFGAELLAKCAELCGSDRADIRLAAVRVYRLGLAYIEAEEHSEGSEGSENAEGSSETISNFRSVVESGLGVFLRILSAFGPTSDPSVLRFGTEVIRTVHFIRSAFPRRFRPQARAVHSVIVPLSQSLAGIYATEVVFDATGGGAAGAALTELLVESVDLLGSYMSRVGISAVSSKFVAELLLPLCLITEAQSLEWRSSLESFVTEETGLATALSLRAAVEQFVDNLSAEQILAIVAQLAECGANKNSDSGSGSDSGLGNSRLEWWRLNEAQLFLKTAIWGAQHPPSGLPPSALVSQARELAAQTRNQPQDPYGFVQCRAVLCIPLFLSATKQRLSPDFAEPLITAAMAAASNGSEFVIVAVLKTLHRLNEAQQSLLRPQHVKDVPLLVQKLLPEAEEDTAALAVEAVADTVAVLGRFNTTEAVETTDATAPQIADIVFAAVGKNPANVLLLEDARDALADLLTAVRPATWAALCEAALPALCRMIAEAVPTGSSEDSEASEASETSETAMAAANAALELLAAVFDSHRDEIFPYGAFALCFPILCRLLLNCRNDSVVQSGSVAFCRLLERSHKFVASEPEAVKAVLQVAAVLLNPAVSDEAAATVGGLVVDVLQLLGSAVAQHAAELVTAAAQRLIVAESLRMCSGLLRVFCWAVLSGPEAAREVVDLLAAQQVAQTVAQPVAQSMLSAVLDKWLQTFGYVRGYAEIRRNVLALARIYMLEDPRVSAVEVDGDLVAQPEAEESGAEHVIVTRSKAKQRPAVYTRVSVPEKIVKLFVKELAGEAEGEGFAAVRAAKMAGLVGQNGDVGGDEEDSDDSGDDDEDNGEDWEDLDDNEAPTYEDLRQFVIDLPEESGVDKWGNGGTEETEGEDGGESITEILIAFFREVSAKNIGDFAEIYKRLTEDEKSVLAKNIAY